MSNLYSIGSGSKIFIPDVTLSRLTVTPSVFVRMLKSTTLSTRGVAAKTGLSKSAVQRWRVRLFDTVINGSALSVRSNY